VIRRNKTLLPTSAELRILQALWQLRQGTIEDIVRSFPAKDRPKYKTTQTFLRIMEGKKFVTHEVQGRVFVYTPLVEREEINQRSVQNLLQQNFAGSASGLMVNLLASHAVPQTDLDQLEEMIREYKNRKEPPARTRK
jgi:BlaI family penicillinase repressor